MRILNDMQQAVRRDRQERDFVQAEALLQSGNAAPMERLAQEALSDAWLALANYYGSDHSQDAAMATEAYRHAIECNDWLGTSRISWAEDEYDRRRFLGIGISPDYPALAKKWSGLYESGWTRETELAWIHAFGPAELRDLKVAWWWVAMAEARWSRLRDADLPTSSAVEVYEHLVKSVPEEDRLRIQSEAKRHVYEDFVRGK